MVPLSGSLCTAVLLARIGKDKSSVMVYGFNIVFEGICHDLDHVIENAPVVLIAHVSGLRIKRGDWPIVGHIQEFKRSNWPVPTTFYAPWPEENNVLEETYDDDFNELSWRRVPLHSNIDPVARAGVMNGPYLETFLARILNSDQKHASRSR